MVHVWEFHTRARQLVTPGPAGTEHQEPKRLGRLRQKGTECRDTSAEPSQQAAGHKDVSETSPPAARWGCDHVPAVQEKARSSKTSAVFSGLQQAEFPSRGARGQSWAQTFQDLPCPESCTAWIHVSRAPASSRSHRPAAPRDRTGRGSNRP